jgi:hypothetical protein
MNKPSTYNQYMQRYSTFGKKWKLTAPALENVSQVVVIPAYAEKEMLFSTLASLARNQSSSLAYSFILCVINNKKNSPDEVKANNQQTLRYLEMLAGKLCSNSLSTNEDLKNNLKIISDSHLRIGYIDASSEGYEIPENVGGVGMARKIGMDAALCLLQKESSCKKIIINLDADTLVQTNYLAAIKNCFTGKVRAAVVAYQHQEPSTDEGKAAIYCYEIFLRYWILGLKYAKSHYAFHSVGSTMICSTDAYLEVRGMNRREAGEDFYFLNKLAKLGNISYIKDTCVYPSARASLRVPFGTGKRIQRFLSGGHEEYVLYNPLVFEVLAEWLLLMEQTFHCDGKEIIEKAERINPLLVPFLTDCKFEYAWSRIRNNVRDEDNLIKQLNCWFDGFKTLKFINHLSRNSLPPIDMFTAVNNLLEMQKFTALHSMIVPHRPPLREQRKILHHLRELT